MCEQCGCVNASPRILADGDIAHEHEHVHADGTVHSHWHVHCAQEGTLYNHAHRHTPLAAFRPFHNRAPFLPQTFSPRKKPVHY